MTSRTDHKISFIANIIITCMSIIFLTSTPSIPAEVTLAWDDVDPPLDGYLLFIRAENYTYDYDDPIWFGTETTCTIDELSDGTYYFVVRAYYDIDESGDSNEVEVIIRDSIVYTPGDDCDIDGSDLADFINSNTADFDLDTLAAAFGSGACP